MREILFRGKRLDNGEWACGSLISCGITGKAFILPVGSDANESEKVGHEGCLAIVTFEVEPETVGQFAGLADKNGKKIFEGDIVTQFITCHATNGGQHKTRIGYIAYLQQECGFSLVLKNSDVRIGHRNTGSGYTADIDMEVIGNRWDNPELLEGVS